jgi:hypothetical protein
VFRLLMLLALVRLLGQSTGLDLALESCESPCEEASGGECAPGCEDCLCCPHPRTAMLQTQVVNAVPAVSRVESTAVTGPVEAIRADEIFHIPKHAPSRSS